MSRPLSRIQRPISRRRAASSLSLRRTSIRFSSRLLRAQTALRGSSNGPPAAKARWTSRTQVRFSLLLCHTNFMLMFLRFSDSMTLSQYLGLGGTSRGRATINGALSMSPSTLPYLHSQADIDTVVQGITNVVNILKKVPNLTMLQPTATGSITSFVSGVSSPFPSSLPSTASLSLPSGSFSSSTLHFLLLNSPLQPSPTLTLTIPINPYPHSTLKPSATAPPTTGSAPARWAPTTAARRPTASTTPPSSTQTPKSTAQTTCLSSTRASSRASPRETLAARLFLWPRWRARKFWPWRPRAPSRSSGSVADRVIVGVVSVRRGARVRLGRSIIGSVCRTGWGGV